MLEEEKHKEQLKQKGRSLRYTEASLSTQGGQAPGPILLLLLPDTPEAEQPTALEDLKPSVEPFPPSSLSITPPPKQMKTASLNGMEQPKPIIIQDEIDLLTVKMHVIDIGILSN
jgi:hypothetical protein